jgi:uncharacterized membrane protein
MTNTCNNGFMPAKFTKVLLPLLIVIVLSIPGIYQLFRPHFFTSQDGPGHVIRMDEFYHSFTDGQIPVRWSKRLYDGYGYPFFNFNYPSIYYAGLPVMFLGFDATAAMKTEMIVTFTLSGILMFLYLRRKVSAPFAVLGSVLYMYAPYRMVNIFVRGSVAESAAFVFPPLLLWCAENLSLKKPKSILWTGLVIGALGISHNISALILFAVFFGYNLVLSIQRKSPQPFIRGVIAFLIGLMLCAFFFIPALTEKQYTFLDNTIAKDYPNHFVHLPQLLASGWSFGDNLSLNIGYVQFGLFLLACASVVIAWKQWRKFSTEDSQLYLFSFCVIAFFAAVFFMVPSSKFLWDHLPLLPFVQFPWRFLMVTVPVLSIAGTLGLYYFARARNWSNQRVWILVAVLVGVMFFIAKGQWNINQEVAIPVVPGDALEGTTTWADEQATKWFLPKPKVIPAQHVQVLSAKSTAVIGTWKTGEHDYTINAVTDSKVLENTMYYPGWRVWVDDTEVPVNYLDKQYPGRLVYNVTEGEHAVVSRFTETPSREAMDWLSELSFVGVVLLLLRPAKTQSATAQASTKKKKSKKSRSLR